MRPQSYLDRIFQRVSRPSQSAEGTTPSKIESGLFIKETSFSKRPTLGEGRGLQVRQWEPQLQNRKSRRSINPERHQVETQDDCICSKEIILNNIPSETLKSMGLVHLPMTGASPAGMLAHFAQNWDKITKDRWILSAIKGYRLEFHTTPYQAHEPHPSVFNQEHQLLVELELQKLLDKGAVLQTESVPKGSFFSTLFLVPKKDGGQRPVINLKCLNTFVVSPHFKMEGIQTFKSLVKRGDWLVKVDLKDAYFSIPIDREHWKYLCFKLGGKTYQFTCLPFGLTSAPWVFTKTLKPIVALGRELGFCLDILLMAESRELALEP